MNKFFLKFLTLFIFTVTYSNISLGFTRLVYRYIGEENQVLYSGLHQNNIAGNELSILSSNDNSDTSKFTLTGKIKINDLNIPDSTDLYVGDSTSKSLYYCSLMPVQAPKGVLVLLCGTWETTLHVIQSNTGLIEQAHNHQLAVIIPSLNQRLSLNTTVLQFLNTVFTDAMQKYHLPADKFIIGGLSMGGLFSLRYAELSAEDPTQTDIHPKAVYSVDGPTDLENLYYSFKRRFNNPRNANKGEAEYAIKEFEKFMGGSPEQYRKQYIHYSTFSKSEEDGGNAKYLLNIPVRIYNDLDVNWWIENRGNDLYDMNALDQSAFINHLIGRGNKKAAFINAIGKGYRLEGNRHPHSWSIVDPEECIEWILACLSE
jgi:hypothetical protein